MAVFSIVGDTKSTDLVIAAKPDGAATSGNYRRQTVYQQQIQGLLGEAETRVVDKLYFPYKS